MVKILESDAIFASDNGLASKEKEALANCTMRDQLSTSKLQLVVQARELLRTHYESDLEESERIYSRRHYDELMDPDSPFTCWRYILHRDEKVENAVELMKQALAWRQTNRIDTLEARDLIKDFWLRAPIGFVGHTRDGHDLVYAIGKNYRKPDSSIKQTIRDFIAFLLFDWDRRHHNDLRKFVAVFDVSNTGLRNMDLDFSAWLVSIRDYVPARVHAVHFVGMPFIVRPIIKLIISWLPERFRRITYCVSFDEMVRQTVDEHNLPSEVGGLAGESWRLAPLEARWAHEDDAKDSLPEADEIFAKICEACSFNSSPEELERLYQMQRDYENKVAKV